MKYSQIKQFKNFCENFYSAPDWREVLENILKKNDDFEIDGVRFIHSAFIDGIMQDELSNDEYILGCFSSWFLADVLDIDQEVIEEMQKAEVYSAIGKLVLRLDKIEELQSEYVRHEGYGHFFNRYDFSEHEITVNGEKYHVFDNHQ